MNLSRKPIVAIPSRTESTCRAGRRLRSSSTAGRVRSAGTQALSHPDHGALHRGAVRRRCRRRHPAAERVRACVPSSRRTGPHGWRCTWPGPSAACAGYLRAGAGAAGPPHGRRSTLAQRAGRNGPQVAHPLDQIRDQREAATSPATEPRGSVPRHCWVVDCAYAPRRWRLDPDGWQGRVLLAVADRSGPVVVEAWVPSTQLRPTSAADRRGRCRLSRLLRRTSPRGRPCCRRRPTGPRSRRPSPSPGRLRSSSAAAPDRPRTRRCGTRPRPGSPGGSP
jgi:hypothetical protein